jgi:hypothetical protein
MGGIDPPVFGPEMWKTIHLVALGAPAVFDASHVATYKAFYTQLAFVIPCDTCKEHFIQTLHDNPIDESLSGSEALFAWTVRVHNVVNKRLGKPEMSLENARKILLTQNKCITFKNNQTAIILGLSSIIAGYIFYRLYWKKR